MNFFFNFSYTIKNLINLNKYAMGISHKSILFTYSGDILSFILENKLVAVRLTRI